MALQPSVTPYLKKFAAQNVRGFAAVAATKTSPSTETQYLIPREEMKISNVNNMAVASIETNKPLTRISVFVKAGSRYETDRTQGLTQTLRICAGLGTQHYSHFGTVRTIEQNGGQFTCTSGREYIGFTIQTSRDKIDNIDKYLREISCYPVFKPWEISDNLPRLRLERAIRPPEIRILELIHKSAYRRGLGYSLYSPKWMIGNHSSEMLNQFVKDNFSEASVVATGMNHEIAKIFASKVKLPAAGKSRTLQASKFHGGSELRKETAADLAYVALAIEGASASNHKALVASALAQRALGGGSRTKRGQNSGSKLLAAVGDKLAVATAFSVNYSDSGLLGIYIAATPCSVEGITKKSAEVLLGGNLTEPDIARAKTQLKTDIAFATESDGGLVEEVGQQLLFTGSVASPAEINSLIDSVTASEVNALLKKGKISMASFGNIANVPHVDQLK